jgi:predicted metal-dependent phosphoesterase TrpH
MIDLHVHTDASADAQHSPAELFAMAQALGLRCLAFADHNTIAALPAGLRLARATGVEFIGAVELNTHLDGRELHLLGYGVDPAAPAVRAWFDEIDAMFRRQTERRVARFVELGFALTVDDVRRVAGSRLPTGSSFLDALAATPANREHPLLRPYLVGPKAANRYVNFYFEVMAGDGPANVGDESLPVRDAIARLRAVGAAPVAAHPRDLPEAEFRKLIDAGLLGVEAICSYHDAATAQRWRGLAARYGVLHTAGSDFHGVRTKAGVKLGDLPGAGYDLVERLREALDDLSTGNNP